MPEVIAKMKESAESIIRRFKRLREKAGVITEVKKNLRHTKPTELRTQRKAAARKRWLKKLAKEAPIPSRGVRGRKAKKARNSRR